MGAWVRTDQVRNKEKDVLLLSRTLRRRSTAIAPCRPYVIRHDVCVLSRDSVSPEKSSLEDKKIVASLINRVLAERQDQGLQDQEGKKINHDWRLLRSVVLQLFVDCVLLLCLANGEGMVLFRGAADG